MDDPEVEHGQETAIRAYREATNRIYIPGELVCLPTDALVFNTYQTVYPTIEAFRAGGCKYDEETNEWLEWYTTDHLMQSFIPPIYVDILDDGVAVVDGSHRVSGRLIHGKKSIMAFLNAWD